MQIKFIRSYEVFLVTFNKLHVQIVDVSPPFGHGERPENYCITHLSMYSAILDSHKNCHSTIQIVFEMEAGYHVQIYLWILQYKEYQQPENSAS